MNFKSLNFPEKKYNKNKESMHKTALNQTVVFIIRTKNPWKKDPKQQQEPNKNPMHDEHAKYKNKPRPHMVKVMLKIRKKKKQCTGEIKHQQSHRVAQQSTNQKEKERHPKQQDSSKR